MFKQRTNSDQWHGSPNHKLMTTVWEVEDLAKSWNAFTETISLPMQQFGWIKACATNFSSTQELKIVVYGTSEKPLAIAPLVRNSTRKNGRLEIAGFKELSEPVDLIWANRQSLKSLITALTRLRTPLILDRLPADSPSIDIFKKAFHGKGVVLCREGVGYPFIPLNESWRMPEQNLSSRRSSDLRRARRKAEKIGPVKIEILSPQPNELDPLLDLAFAIEANSWKGRMKTALVEDVTRGTFFRQYAHYASREGILRTCFLHIGDKTVAMQLAVECSNRFWLLKIGYDEQFAHCSPGNLLLRNTIKYAAENGLDSYDFLGKVEPWTLVWTSSERPYVSLRVYPFTLHGINALGADLGQFLYRKLKARLKWRKK
jgi:CelD/BcsL family acetyltransferase involved in cellulose biosynthesis